MCEAKAIMEKRPMLPQFWPKLFVPMLVVTVALLLNFNILSSRIVDSDDGLRSTKGSSLRRHARADASTHREGAGSAAGHFNHLPVRYRPAFGADFHSTAHCLGENFVDEPKRTANNAWKYRSCHFRNLCFDLVDQEFVLFLSAEQVALRKALDRSGEHQFWPAGGTTEAYAVAVGGIHPRFGGKDIALKWYPKLRNISDFSKEGSGENSTSAGFYELPSNYVLVPWNSYHGFNPGHIITDDFLPIYTLLASFGLTDKKLAMIHIDLPLDENVNWWDSCQNHWQECKPYLTKFLPLLGTTLQRTSTQYTAALKVKNEEGPRSRYVCAAHGAAGMVRINTT